MKTLLHSQVLLGVVLMASFIAAPPVWAAGTDRAPAAAPELLVRVHVPSLDWRPFFQEQVERYLAVRVRRQFRRDGYKGAVVRLGSTSKSNPALPRLSITLMEWRLDPVGEINCTVSAALHMRGQVKNLGIATDSQFTWAPRFDRWAMSDAFKQAVDGAIGRLCRRVARTGLLSGFSTT